MHDRLNQESTFCVYSDVMETLRFRGSVFFRSELAAPWGISLEPTTFPRFHIALSGNCFVGTDAGDAVEVRDSEIVVFPGSEAHWIADRPGRALVASARATRACELNDPLFRDGEITNRIMCGQVQFDRNASHPFIDALPEIMHFPQLSAADPVWMTVRLIDAELHAGRDPDGPIIDRLTEVLFLQLLHHYIRNNPQSSGFLSALSDRRVLLALKLIHKQPQHEWTPTELGNAVGMSRATLNRRFQQSVGTGPIAYLNNWRIMKAYSLVKYSAQPLEQIAEAVGFASARTLARAFKRQYDCTPQELRRAKESEKVQQQ